MGRNSKIVVAAILALAIVGCSSEGEQQSSNPTLTNTPTTIKKGATLPFNNPVVPAKKTPSSTVGSAGLIQPTNPTERIGVVSKGRADPFAQIIGPYPLSIANTTVVEKTKNLPTPRVVEKRQINKTVAISPAIKISKTKSPLTRVKPKLNLRTNLTRPVLPKVLPQVIPNQTLVSVLPPPPQPELAKAVLVTGVVLVGQEPQAIIKVPTEPTSRYVQAGQRLASGLLIKRIEMNEGSEPTVILEQYGIEVAKMVGEAPLNSKPSSALPGAT
ncbi:hypothetical protein G7B40_022160 [Aetokthonos hydrillicola Thurmond2011]|jgi:hypothetical protein|uniref:Uncharacterized protein n=1 Tax=Aetokthonos hydrillicola Thurmond2011 TaxID=2712845 RepID=A0AAP5I936_9CYAN|nr:hypothetical protein [Aetokthonos hydrillicola]MBO3460809.1 hypothetical protein [Aetokthonos hydrillicola CCALA 1050]MBW4588272.1 hypothetical protein [Aetokthonos hydrillicola CCALA 1050]MDR9897248.1 hypothetical protein [Aetokthonos hydrillicola Thurmond2011]